MGVWYMSHSKVRGTDENGNPYNTEATIAAENAKHQNLHTKLAQKRVYTKENTGPENTTSSSLESLSPEYRATINERDKFKGFEQNCTISGGKKSRKSHNSKKSRKSKRSHTTYKKSKRSRR